MMQFQVNTLICGLDTGHIKVSVSPTGHSRVINVGMVV